MQELRGNYYWKIGQMLGRAGGALAEAQTPAYV